MAQVVSVQVLANPDETDFAGQTNPCPAVGIGVNKIQAIKAATASQITSYPSAVSQIIVTFNIGQQVYTGAYLSGTAVATLIANSNS